MRKLIVGFCLLAFFSIHNTYAQTHPSAHPKTAVPADPTFFKNLGAVPTHMAASAHMSSATSAATMQQPQRIVTVPTFVSAFKFQGQVFPYTMIGQAPQGRATTVIPTSYIPMSFFFDDFVDASGNNVTIDATAITDEILTSPEFLPSAFSTGTTQYTDAVQRAEFFKVINRDGDNDGDDNWHTLYARPRILTQVVIEVPAGSSEVFVLPDGTFFALIDINFINSQIFTLLQTEGVNVHELPILLTRNAVYGDFKAGQPLDCCIGGFHSALETGQVNNNISVQVFSFATSLDPDVADGVFGDPGVFADVNALSHEIAEATDDPFGNNITPNYQIPGAPAGACQNNLEIGDVIENLTPDYLPILLHGFIYHPQTMGLLQWFEGKVPSNAVDHAYSFPDKTLLTSPFTPCPPATP